MANDQYLPSPQEESNSSVRDHSLISDDEFQDDDHASFTSQNSPSQQQQQSDASNRRNANTNFETNNNNFNTNTNESSVYNQVIKIEPELAEHEVSFSAGGNDPFQVPLPTSLNNTNNIRHVPCSSRALLHYRSPQTKRRRIEAFPQPSTEEESTLSTVLERVLGEGLRTLTSQRHNSTTIERTKQTNSDFREIDDHSKNDKKHPDHFFYEFIKDITLNWTNEQRRKLRNKINQVLEEVEEEVETDNN